MKWVLLIATVMQVTVHQIAGNVHFLLLFGPSLIAGNMINYTQIDGILAIAGKLASLLLKNTLYGKYKNTNTWFQVTNKKIHKNPHFTEQ